MIKKKILLDFLFHLVLKLETPLPPLPPPPFKKQTNIWGGFVKTIKDFYKFANKVHVQYAVLLFQSVNIAFGFWVQCCTNWATSCPAVYIYIGPPPPPFKKNKNAKHLVIRIQIGMPYFLLTSFVHLLYL